MMSTKMKTSEDYARELAKLKEKEKALLVKQREATKAEQARYNLAVLSAAREMCDAYSVKWEDAAEQFKKWAEQHRQHTSGGTQYQ